MLRVGLINDVSEVKTDTSQTKKETVKVETPKKETATKQQSKK